jgi:PleD family two-component response regulator
VAARILLADDSAIAQRLGERMLREEGYEVVSVTDGETALLRLADVDPDVLIADAFLPKRTGFELAQFVRETLAHRHIGVLLSGSITEPVDSDKAAAAGADGIVQKPFGVGTLIETLVPLLDKVAERRLAGEFGADAPPLPIIPIADEERVRAAVTVALDEAMPQMVELITREVLRALRPS